MILISAQAFPPQSGGIQTLMAGLAQAASAHNAVLVLADKTNANSLKFDNEQPYNVQRFDGFKPFRRYRKVKAVKQCFNENIITHLICDSWKSAEYLPDDLDCPVIIYAHGNEFPQNHEKLRRIQKSLHKVDHIIAVSHQTAKRIKPFLPKTKTPKITVMPNPVSPPLRATADDIVFAHTLWPENKTRLLSLCRLINWKGVDRSILAVLDCKKNNKPVHLVIAGNGDDAPRLKRLVADNNLTSDVTFVGRIEGSRKTALFESADIYLQAGRTEGDQCEGFGISYIEAGLHGLPTIAGQDGGAPDAVLEGQTGFIVDGNNQKNVSTALFRLIDEPALASHMGKDAHKRAQDLLWDKQIIQVLSLNKEFKE